MPRFVEPPDDHVAMGSHFRHVQTPQPTDWRVFGSPSLLFGKQMDFAGMWTSINPQCLEIFGIETITIYTFGSSYPGWHTDFGFRTAQYQGSQADSPAVRSVLKGTSAWPWIFGMFSSWDFEDWFHDEKNGTCDRFWWDFHLFHKKKVGFCWKNGRSLDFTIGLPLVSAMNMANWRVPWRCRDSGASDNSGGLRLEHNAEINM